MFQNLTSKKAVLEAVAEYDRLGAAPFLTKYGFGKARRYYLLHNGKYYDSKAIVGIAYGYQFDKPLTPSDFGGGKATVAPKLKSLGFQVVADSIKDASVALAEEAQANELWEGAKQTVTVNSYERSAVARAECIEHHGSACCICGFDFATVYGNDFLGFIHVHHLVPLSKKRAAYKVIAKEDLRPVCPNCHAIIHYGGATRSIEQVTKLVTKSKPNKALNWTRQKRRAG